MNDITAEAAAELIAAMVAIPSVNPKLRSPGAPDAWFGEERMAHFVRDWLVGEGIEAVLDEVEPGRPNVVARLPGPPGARRVVWEGHLDTVQVDGMADPFTPVVRDGRLHGRGAVDDKASLAMFMLALRVVRDLRRDCDITFVAAIDEEVSFTGVTHHIARGERYDMGVAGEPTSLRIVTACKGTIRFFIDVHGRNAHSSRPQEGVDAIAIAADLHAHLRAYMAGTPQHHPMLGPRTLTCTMISGGEGPNSVPAFARLTFDFRTLPEQTGAEAWDEIAAVVAAFPAPPGARIAMQPPFIDSISMEVPADAEIVGRLQAALAAEGLDGTPEGAPFGSDATKFTRDGTPCVVFGPGGIAQAHAPDEYVDLAEVARAARILVATVVPGDLPRAVFSPIVADPS
jgi:acetylornithine deacetylase